MPSKATEWMKGMTRNAGHSKASTTGVRGSGDITATTAIIPTASNALYKRCVVIEHVG